MRPMESCGHTLQVWNPTELTLKDWRLWDGLGGVANLSLGWFGILGLIWFRGNPRKSRRDIWNLSLQKWRGDSPIWWVLWTQTLWSSLNSINLPGWRFLSPKIIQSDPGFQKGVWKYFSTRNDSAGSWKSLTLRGQKKFFVAWRDKIILTNPLLNPDYCWRRGVLLMVGKCYKIWLGMINDRWP